MNVLLILSTCIFLSGYFTLPVTCLEEPEPNRLLRPVDPVFVDTLKSHMKSNPSRDVTPIVGLVWLPGVRRVRRVPTGGDQQLLYDIP